MKFKVGDLVRNIRQHRITVFADEGLGIVVEIEEADIPFPQLKVATAQGITYWWPSVTEVISESR
jgi:hypothetical protein